ncbi:hypothetical protein N431DRAFT_398157 [Stipitochalara longipes BDJ]|nr:hypothetical protein N431DRAFT_398157 [Stipitochalara longipes BDJ]
MIAIAFIIFFFLGSVAANPVAQPHRHHKDHDHDQACPVNGTLNNSNYFGVKTMVPVSASQPSLQLGSSTTAIITPNDYCTIFNLVVPPSGLNKTCTLQLLIPDRQQAGFNYTFAGPGNFTFTGYAFGPPSLLTPGNGYVINVGPCGIQPGMTGMEASGLLCSPDTTFVYQQSEEKCPIGFFVTIT